MLANPMDVLTVFPVRKTKRQKQAFRDAVRAYAQSLGYESRVEKGSFGSRNLVIGDPERASYLITAHYDTCARLPFPNYTFPCNFWIFLAWQAAVTALIFGVVFAVTAAVELLTSSQALGSAASLLSIWVILALVYVGPANLSNVNDNSSGVITALEIARTLPENQRNKVCFVLFDLEEAGLLGSASYRSAHKKETDRQLVINLDCVGDGDYLTMFPTGGLKKDRKKLTSLYKACGYFGKKSLLLKEKGFAFYPSDQTNFPYGVGVCALQKGKRALYLGRIHTPKDTILEQTNVNLLRAALVSFVCCPAVPDEKGKEE